MLLELKNEVLGYGPTAVLPQNLSSEWLRRLQERADDFLDSNFETDACRIPEGPADPLLGACVREILKYGEENTDDFTEAEILEKITLFSLNLTLESADRESPIGLPPPNLNNILSWERLSRFRDRNPEFIDALENACILRNPKQSWLRDIGEKFLQATGIR